MNSVEDFMFHQIQDLKLWVLSVSSSSWKSLEGFKLLIQYPNYLELDDVAKKERWKIENSNRATSTGPT